MVKRTTSDNTYFQNLTYQLDQYLAIIDGEEHGFYNQFNALALLNHCIVIYDNKAPIGCGALKKYDDTGFEIKRMFTHPSHRGKGIATQLLQELENWAKELGAEHCLLETGNRMPDAIGLYTKNGYKRIPNYGPYEGVANSVCFKKVF